MNPPALKYLFEVDYIDGTDYRQPANDISPTRPDKSAYWDVMQRLGDVRSMALLDGEFPRLSVDLTDGSFTVDTHAFFAAPCSMFSQRPWLPRGGKFRLQYFRERVEAIINNVPQPSEVVGYYVGWDYVLPDGSVAASQVVMIT